VRSDARRAASPRALLLVAALAAAAFATGALAADASVNPASSSIVATFRQQGVAIEAPFRRFGGTINYDAANPAATSATVSVEVASLDAGDEASSAEVRKPAWFDSARYPQAVFRSTAIKPMAAGQLEATGTLAIKGTSRTVTVSIKVSGAGRAHAFDGSLGVSRKAYGIGDPSWDGVLDDIVSVRFHLLAGP
jgi:polyisoprenoid-binding protein YceI